MTTEEQQLYNIVAEQINARLPDIAHKVSGILFGVSLENCTKAEQASVSIQGEDDMPEFRQRVLLGYDASGTPVRKQLRAKSIDELNDKIVKAYVDSGRIEEFMQIPQLGSMVPEEPPKKQTPFDAYAKKWFKTYKENTVSENYKVTLRTQLKQLCARFGKKAIEDITVSDVQDMLNEHDGRSKVTMKGIWATLKQVLRSAVEDGIIDVNPAASTRLKQAAKESEGTKALTREEYFKVLEDIPKLEDERERMLIALLCYTGMRREEVLGLRWEDVDFEQSVVHVKRAVTYPKYEPELKETKSKNGVRGIPMPEALRDILYPLRRDSGWVVSDNGSGKLINQREYNAIWKKLNTHIYLFGAGARELRSTYATMAAAAGIQPKTLQHIMGHAKSQLTMDIYVKQDSEGMQIASGQLENFLERGVSNVPAFVPNPEVA